MVDGGKRKGVFGFEVVEEATLGDTCCLADVVNRRRSIALGADDVKRGVEEPGLGFMLELDCHEIGLFQIGSIEPYRLVGMVSR